MSIFKKKLLNRWVMVALVVLASAANSSTGKPQNIIDKAPISLGEINQTTVAVSLPVNQLPKKSVPIVINDVHTQQHVKLPMKSTSIPIELKKQSTAVSSVTPGVSAGAIKKYIIRLKGSPVAQYQGGVSGLAATSIQTTGKSAQFNVTSNTQLNKNARGILNAKSVTSRAYALHLEKSHSNFRTQMQQTLGRKIHQSHAFKYALNGVGVALTQAEAAKVAAMPDVLGVELDIALPVDTSDTPRFIGAQSTWNGSGTGLDGVKGEGMLVGIIDTGIDHLSPSFAARGDDGYTHINPLGNGIYLGECLTKPSLCNDKLIGAYAFLDGQTNGVDPSAPPGDPVSKDTDGHGSHVASTVAGNVNKSATIFDFNGKDSGISLGTISGIAPHANIIMYKVCAPSCYTSDIINALDQAILDGVDAVNHSIGSVPTSPWHESKSLAFLNARAAGIMVQNSAGNTAGVGSAATSGNAPWVTSVAWSSHDRDFTDKFLQDFQGGEGALPSNIAGKSLSGSYTGPLVSAGNFSNGDATPSQCLVPFPEGTFAGAIVICERGTISRVQKCANVAAGGAKGCVLANVQGGANSIDPDMMPIPAIHISAANGVGLKTWLETGTGHIATITDTSKPFSNSAAGDILSSSSSTGPYTGFDFLAPSVSAPGVNIFAAGANLQFTHPGFSTPDPDDDPSVAGAYGVISGSSMASPHMTGSALLVKQLHPNWTPAEVLSAFMTTGKTDLLKSDGVTHADPFDIGGGRVQVNKAAKAALILDETAINFLDADPNTGGDPSSLNVASLVQDQCTFSCTWQRTVKATTSGSWTTKGVWATGSTSAITVSPASFTLAAGQTQVLTITASALGLPEGAYSFGHVLLEPINAGVPTTTIPLAIRPSTATNNSVFVKTVDKLDAGNGEKLTYSLKVNNLGDLDSFSVTDVVPRNARFVPGSATEVITNGQTTAKWVNTAGSVTWSGILNPTTGKLIESPSPFGFIPMSLLGVEPLGCPSNCDDGGWVVNNVNITYFGKVYDSLILSVNGAIELGTASGSTASGVVSQLPSKDANNNIIAPFWTDLNMENGGQMFSASLSTDDGTVYDVFSWENIPLYGSQWDTTYSFQIWSQQGTENIWFVYGGVPVIPVDNLSVGFENATGTIGASYYFNGTGTEPLPSVDLKMLNETGGSATLTFDVIVHGLVGGKVLNEASMKNSTTTERAFAFTTINSSGEVDTDKDGIFDSQDNCTKIPNPSQCDSDADGYGNVCDADFNNSGFVNKRDIALITKNLFKKSKAPTFSQYDMNCSGGLIGFDDYLAALKLFWTQPGPSGLVGADNPKNTRD